MPWTMCEKSSQGERCSSHKLRKWPGAPTAAELGPEQASNKVRLVDNPGPQSLRARISKITTDKVEEEKTNQTDPSQREAETDENVASLLRRFAEYK
ncbi:hypothetical protein PTTG_26726 [Puccinia triticina 1-1 BBBD Race 1]|uniref:Uncharacterized protein n=1 Tax=Puccinia triticina (isolate 1-1 / race 1 (BBBD)) TaxID=630390 RepID=A0A180GSJ5_PUCT1|nr:hypothetical protein PTTG_26726 [Puccinia triticina 1-1 BBBD Race 1]